MSYIILYYYEIYHNFILYQFITSHVCAFNATAIGHPFLGWPCINFKPIRESVHPTATKLQHHYCQWNNSYKLKTSNLNLQNQSAITI